MGLGLEFSGTVQVQNWSIADVRPNLVADFLDSWNQQDFTRNYLAADSRNHQENASNIGRRSTHKRHGMVVEYRGSWSYRKSTTEARPYNIKVEKYIRLGCFQGTNLYSRVSIVQNIKTKCH